MNKILNEIDFCRILKCGNVLSHSKVKSPTKNNVRGVKAPLHTLEDSDDQFVQNVQLAFKTGCKKTPSNEIEIIRTHAEVNQ